MTCKDCLYYEPCSTLNAEFKKHPKDFIDSDLCAKQSTTFKDRSRFVELPDVGDYDTVTTIDEAIDHCYQIATSTDETVCAECKAEHMRLCGWLGDLKRRIAAAQAVEGA